VLSCSSRQQKSPLIPTLTIRCVLCRSGRHSDLVRLNDGAELLQPPVTSRVEAACDRDACCVATMSCETSSGMRRLLCGVKGLSRKSDGFLAFLRYASGKHTRSADNSPPDAQAPALAGASSGALSDIPRNGRMPSTHLTWSCRGCGVGQSRHA